MVRICVGGKKVNVIKVIKTIKTKADFEAIKTKYKMRFFTATHTIRFGNYIQFAGFPSRHGARVGFFGLASHVKDFSLLAHILWMKKFRPVRCVRQERWRGREGSEVSGDVRMKAFNDPLNNLIQHKELKGSCEN